MELKNVTIAREKLTSYVKDFASSPYMELVRRVGVPVLAAVVALAVSGVETVFGICPFGVAMLCAAKGFVMSSSVLIGAVLGAVSAGDSLYIIGVLCAVYALRYAMSFFVCKRFTVEKALLEPIGLRIATSVAASGALSLVYISGAENIVMAVITVLAAFFAFPAFCAAFILLGDASASRSLRLTGLLGAFICVGTTLSRLSLPFDAVAVFAFAVAMIVTYKNGAAIGAAAAVCAGIAGQAYFAPLYALSALTAGLVFEWSAVAAVSLAAVVGVAWALYAGGLSGISGILPEIIFSAAACAPLISCKIIKKTELFQALSEPARQDAHLAAKMDKISNGFEAISKLLYSLADRMDCPGEDEAQRICMGARSKFCTSCELGCTQRDGEVLFTRAYASLVRNGRVSAKVVPENIARRCHNIDAILDNMNTSSKIYAKMSDSGRRTQLFAGDYKAVSDLLRSIADPRSLLYERDKDGEEALSKRLYELGISWQDVAVYGERQRRVIIRGLTMPSVAGERDIRELAEDVLSCTLTSPEFSIDSNVVSLSMRSKKCISLEVGRYKSAASGESVSGDTTVVFENDEGYVYSLVSDGMGSGRDAAMTSGISGIYLEKLLMAGCPMKSALELLNSFICGDDKECFTTVDLMEADLYTARAKFIKSGAAPSFVLRDKKVFRLHSKTVPVGIIRALDAEMISVELCEGDMIIMLSDGVTGSYEESPWLYELLQEGGLDGCSPQIAAKIIGEAACRESGRADDITVCAIKVGEAVN